MADKRFTPEQVRDALVALGDIASEAWWAITDSEDRREDGFHCVPKENIDTLHGALEKARSLIPDDGEPDYPHHLVDLILDSLNMASDTDDDLTPDEAGLPVPPGEDGGAG